MAQAILEVLKKLRAASEGDPSAIQILDSLKAAVQDMKDQLEDLDEDAAWAQVERDLSFFTYEHLLKSRKDQGLTITADVDRELKQASKSAQDLMRIIRSVRNPV